MTKMDRFKLAFVLPIGGALIAGLVGVLGRVNTNTKSFDDQGEMNKSHEHHVKLLEPGEDAAEAFEAAKQPLNFVSPLVHLSVVLPGLDPGGLGRHDRDESQVQRQLPGFVALVGAIHQQVNRPFWRAQLAQKRPALGPIVGLSGRKGERYGRSSIRGNHMNLGGPSAARLSDGLGTVFFNAPVPSG